MNTWTVWRPLVVIIGFLCLYKFFFLTPWGLNLLKDLHAKSQMKLVRPGLFPGSYVSHIFWTTAKWLLPNTVRSCSPLGILEIFQDCLKLYEFPITKILFKKHTHDINMRIRQEIVWDWDDWLTAFLSFQCKETFPTFNKLNNFNFQNVPLLCKGF